jgi:hypothetical protein
VAQFERGEARERARSHRLLRRVAATPSAAPRCTAARQHMDTRGPHCQQLNASRHRRGHQRAARAAASPSRPGTDHPPTCGKVPWTAGLPPEPPVPPEPPDPVPGPVMPGPGAVPDPTAGAQGRGQRAAEGESADRTQVLGSLCTTQRWTRCALFDGVRQLGSSPQTTALGSEAPPPRREQRAALTRERRRRVAGHPIGVCHRQLHLAAARWNTRNAAAA